MEQEQNSQEDLGLSQVTTAQHSERSLDALKDNVKRIDEQITALRAMSVVSCSQFTFLIKDSLMIDNVLSSVFCTNAKFFFWFQTYLLDFRRECEKKALLDDIQKGFQQLHEVTSEVCREAEELGYIQEQASDTRNLHH